MVFLCWFRVNPFVQKWPVCRPYIPHWRHLGRARLLVLAAAFGAFRVCDGDGTRRLVGTAFGCAGFLAICTAVAGTILTRTNARFIAAARHL